MKAIRGLQKKIWLALIIIVLIFTFLVTLNRAKNHNLREQAYQNEIILYIKQGCSYCEKAENLLTESKIAYELIDLSLDHNLQKKLISKTGQSTVPYIFINNKFIGGYSDLLKLEEEGRL